MKCILYSKCSPKTMNLVKLYHTNVLIRTLYWIIIMEACQEAVRGTRRNASFIFLCCTMVICSCSSSSKQRCLFNFPHGQSSLLWTVELPLRDFRNVIEYAFHTNYASLVVRGYKYNVSSVHIAIQCTFHIS